MGTRSSSLVYLSDRGIEEKKKVFISSPVRRGRSCLLACCDIHTSRVHLYLVEVRPYAVVG